MVYYLFSGIFWLLIILLVFRSFFGRQRRHLRWLQSQIPLWEKQNLISPEQGTNLLSFYRLARVDVAKKLDTVKVLTLIGAVFIGIGIIFLVASNWQEIPKFVRTILLLGVTISTLFAGYYFSFEKQDFPNLGKSLFLLASLFWGGSVALICQIYNIPTSRNWFIFLLWAIPILPVAIFFKNEYTYLLASALLLVWNFTFSVSNNVANYYYPLMVFLILLPLAVRFQIGVWFNIIGLLSASVYALSQRYEFVPLLIGVGLLIYAWRQKEQEGYLIASLVSFIIWVITFFIIRETVPNFYFFIPLMVNLYFIYSRQAVLSLAVAIIGWIIWLNLLLAAYMHNLRQSFTGETFVVLQIFLGVVIFLTGRLQERLKPELARAYRGVGAVVCFCFVYALAFKEIYQVKEVVYGVHFFSALFFFFIGLVLLTNLFLQKVYTEKSNKLELFGALSVLAVSVFILLNLPQALINTILANALLILFAVILLLAGVEEQNPAFFNLGIAVFVLLIITRYIDVFWRLKEKSFFFIISGIVLLVGGVALEKKRRQITEGMKTHE